jgi:hypothetical protein
LDGVNRGETRSITPPALVLPKSVALHLRRSGMRALLRIVWHGLVCVAMMTLIQHAYEDEGMPHDIVKRFRHGRA